MYVHRENTGLCEYKCQYCCYYVLIIVNYDHNHTGYFVHYTYYEHSVNKKRDRAVYENRQINITIYVWLRI